MAMTAELGVSIKENQHSLSFRGCQVCDLCFFLISEGVGFFIVRGCVWPVRYAFFSCNLWLPDF